MRDLKKANDPRRQRRARFAPLLAVVAIGLALVLAAPAHAQTSAPSAAPTLDEIVSAVVRVKTFINPDARTGETLGREREGTGVVIDNNGLILTIGYLMLEAHAAEVQTSNGRTVPADIVGYDHDTGFGLLRALSSLKARPLALGKAADVKQGDRVIIARHGGRDGLAPAFVASTREFPGYWEYLLDRAIFTIPAAANWSGAGLITRDGKLVGIGSLVVGDAPGEGDQVPGNMFVPIDLLPPILADLIANGRAAHPPRPWLGVNIVELHSLLVVRRVTANSPAAKAGLEAGDIVVGVDGTPAKNLADFYRKVWALGRAGVAVPLDVLQDGTKRRIDVQSMDRMDHLRMKSTF